MSMLRALVRSLTGRLTEIGSTDELSVPGGIRTSKINGADVTVTPEQFGAVGDGTDDSDAFIAMLAALDAGNGGTVLFGAKTYRIDSQIVIPNDGGSMPRQKTIRFIGAGCYRSGQGGAMIGGTILDLRYVGSGAAEDAKILTTGLGALRIEGITLYDGGTSSAPYIYTTNTSLQIIDCAFIGNPSKAGATCDQDAIVCGGTVSATGNSVSDGFQGYGTLIQSNYFNKIRRAIYGRMYFNGNNIRDNTIWNQCGGGAAAIEIDGDPLGGASLAVGNNITGNLIELGTYTYGIKLSHADNNTLAANSGFDKTSSTATVRIESTCNFNTVIGSSAGGAIPYLSDAGSNTSYISSEQTVPSTMRNLTVSNQLIASVQALFKNVNTTIQPVGTQVAAQIVFQCLQSAADGGGNAWNITYGGDFKAYSAGTLTGSFTNFLRTWKAEGTGGNMLQNSGTGGSYLTLQNFGVKYNDHTSVLRFTLLPTANGCDLSGGNLSVKTAGKGLRVVEGSNCKQGTAVLVAGTVTISNTSVTATSRILLTSQSDGGTPGFVRVSARVAGTSFTITSSNALDTSTIAYEIFEPG